MELFCKNCNSKVSEGAKFCPVCGEKVEIQQSIIEETQPYSPIGYVQPTPVQNQPPVQNETTGKKVGFGILSWMVPLFGWIYGGVKRKEEPETSKLCLILSSVSAGLNILIVIITMIFSFSIASKVISPAIDESLNSASEFSENYNGDYSSEEDELIEPAANSTTETSSEKLNNLKYNEIAYNGHKISLPCSFSKFVEMTGAKFDDKQDEQQTLKSGYTGFCTMNIEGYKFNIDLINESKSVKNYKDCSVVGIRISKARDDEYSPIVNRFQLYSGYQIGDSLTKDKLVEKLGDPDYSYNSNNYETYEFKFDNEKYYIKNNIKFEIVDGNLKEVSISAYA